MPVPAEQPPDEKAPAPGNPKPATSAIQPDFITDATASDEVVLFTKVCKKCSVQTEAAGNFCPNCGAAFAGTNKKLKVNKKSLIISISAVVLVIALVLIVQSIVQLNRAAEADKRAIEASAVASRSASAVASESAAAAQLQSVKEAAAVQLEAENDAAEKALRKGVITAVEESVLKDARKRETEGVLTGPFSRASCTALGGGSIDDLTSITGTFECVAVNKQGDDGTESGYVFSATVNWDTGAYQWHLGR